MIYTTQTESLLHEENLQKFLFGIDFSSIRAYNHVRRQKQSAGVKAILERAK